MEMMWCEKRPRSALHSDTRPLAIVNEIRRLLWEMGTEVTRVRKERDGVSNASTRGRTTNLSKFWEIERESSHSTPSITTTSSLDFFSNSFL